jgi:hypothetical protein
VGKTQLAVEYGWKHLRNYDAAFRVKADSPESFDASLAGLTSVLGLPDANSSEQAVQTKAVIAWLNAHGRWLLIADSIDDDAAAKAVCDRLPPSLPGDVLITSRLTRWPLHMVCLSLDSLETNDAALFLLNGVWGATEPRMALRRSLFWTHSLTLTAAVAQALLATPCAALGGSASSALVAARPTHGDDVLEHPEGLILCRRARPSAAD